MLRCRVPGLLATGKEGALQPPERNPLLLQPDALAMNVGPQLVEQCLLLRREAAERALRPLAFRYP